MRPGITGAVHPQPTGCADEVYAELAKCWRFDPDQRPDFGSLKAFFLAVETRAPHTAAPASSGAKGQTLGFGDAAGPDASQHYNLGHQDAADGAAGQHYNLGFREPDAVGAPHYNLGHEGAQLGGDVCSGAGASYDLGHESKSTAAGAKSQIIQPPMDNADPSGTKTSRRANAGHQQGALLLQMDGGDECLASVSM